MDTLFDQIGMTIGALLVFVVVPVAIFILSQAA